MNPFLQKLTFVDGVSGHEIAVRRMIERCIEGKFSYAIDRLGNLIVRSGGYKADDRRLMICAHMDEVGLMITQITERGFLRFSAVGGIDERILPGKTVRVGPENVPGVIGKLAIHLHDKAAREKITPIDELYIDIGAADRAQAEKYVRVGDVAAFTTEGFDLGDKICAKALDDRVGCEVLLHLLQNCPEANFTAVFTKGEEVGCFGATAAAQELRPRYAIVLESTTASDNDPSDPVCKVGEGPVLSFMDRSAIYDRAFLRRAKDAAEKYGVPYQLKQAVAGGNEAGRIQSAADGCYVLAVSLPCRYIHSPYSVAAEGDIEAMKRLVTSIVKEWK